jgi:hypothetical protein
MGTSKGRVDTRASGTGTPVRVSVLLPALVRIHAQSVALGSNAERLEKALASISIESSGDPVRSSPCWGIYEGANIELITARVDSVGRDRGT